jgi:regulator of protease activity HflC (stomatin/prohibitin superfamily)
VRAPLLLAVLLLSSCAVIRPGEVGLKTRFGKLTDVEREAGPAAIGAGIRYLRLPTRSLNLEVSVLLPSAEGLNVQADVSILYHLERDRLREIAEDIGMSWERTVVLPVFRSAVADVCAQYQAKDMHSGQRGEIEERIRERMNDNLSHRGIVTEAVLMKSIQLPDRLYRAIEAKLAAEQEADRMNFVLAAEEREAERRRIEATGIRDAQNILADGLSDAILEWRSVEAFMELANSPNAKVIVTDGSTPFLIQNDETE